jgi:cytochrome c-type biogenesis protein CcmH/NrfF
MSGILRPDAYATNGRMAGLLLESYRVSMDAATGISPCDSRKSWALGARVLLLGVLAWSLSIPSAHAHSRSATELETRLFAPCCYIQTLDVHESELADQLRGEIERRLGAGEAALAIEDDLVVRYGEKIRAVPRDSDPRADIPLIVGIALGIGLLVLAGFALRWQRAQHRDNGAPLSEAVAAKYDRELDDALRRTDPEDPPPLSAA